MRRCPFHARGGGDLTFALDRASVGHTGHRGSHAVPSAPGRGRPPAPTGASRGVRGGLCLTARLWGSGPSRRHWRGGQGLWSRALAGTPHRAVWTWLRFLLDAGQGPQSCAGAGRGDGMALDGVGTCPCLAEGPQIPRGPHTLPVNPPEHSSPSLAGEERSPNLPRQTGLPTAWQCGPQWTKVWGSCLSASPKFLVSHKGEGAHPEPVLASAGRAGGWCLGGLCSGVSVCLVLPPSSGETSAALGPPEPDLANGQLTSWGPGTATVNRPQEEATEDGVGPVGTLRSELFSPRV